jgi:predicted dinucleotide-utilizing enzyme
MDVEQARKLETATEPFALFEGTVADAIELYPGSLNVACALAHATGLWGETRVRLVADPAAERTTHEIVAAGAAGEYRFVMTNAVSEANPTSSAVVAETVLRGIATLAGPGATFV